MELALGVTVCLPEKGFPHEAQKPPPHPSFANEDSARICALDTTSSSQPTDEDCSCEHEHETLSDGTGENDEFELIDYRDCSPAHEATKRQLNSQSGQVLDTVSLKNGTFDEVAETIEQKHTNRQFPETELQGPQDIPTTETGQPRPPPVPRPASISIFVSPAVDSDSPAKTSPPHVRRQSSPATCKKIVDIVSPKLSRKGKEPAEASHSKAPVKRYGSGLFEGEVHEEDINHSSANLHLGGSPRLHRLSKAMRNISFQSLATFASPAAKQRHNELPSHAGGKRLSVQLDVQNVSHVLSTKSTLSAKHEAQLERIWEESRVQGCGLTNRVRAIEADISSGLEPLCSHRDCCQRQLNSATRKLERAYMMVDRYVEAMYHYICKMHTGVWIGCQEDMASADTNTGMWQAERLAIHTLLAQRRARCLEEAHTDAKNAYKVLLDVMAMLRREQKRINKQCTRYKELQGPMIPDQVKMQNSATPLSVGMSSASFGGIGRSPSRAKTTTLSSLAPAANQVRRSGTHIKPEPIYVMHYTPAMPAPYTAVNFHGHPDPLANGV